MPLRSLTIMRLSLLALVAVLTAACGAASGGVDTVRVERDDIEVKPTPTPVPTFDHPLTGKTFEGEQDWQQRRALAIKVENSRMARPQAGLERADVVYEELAEGGITRFIAVFHSRGANRVGPVRSARLVDPDVLAPLKPLFAYAGGVPPVVNAVRSVSGLTDVSYDRATSAYRRVSERKAPHNLYTQTDELWDDREGEPPPPLFSFGEPPAEGGEAGAKASFSFAGNGEPVTWEWDAGDEVYVRSQSGTTHTVEGGAALEADNVVIQLVSVRDGSIRDTAGLVSPDTTVLGDGEAILLRGGAAYRGRWVRSSRSAPTVFQDASGNELAFATGTTWVELVPRTRSVDLS